MRRMSAEKYGEPAIVSSDTHDNGLQAIGDIVEVESRRREIVPLGALEILVEQSKWSEIADKLAPLEESLPDPHRLLYALALRELGDEHSRKANTIAIRAFEGLLGVSNQSPLALMFARRTLTRRTWRQAPAPKPWIQMAIALVAIALGAVVGMAVDEWLDRSRAARVQRSNSHSTTNATTNNTPETPQE
jgi:hypothetical protein